MNILLNRFFIIGAALIWSGCSAGNSQNNLTSIAASDTVSNVLEIALTHAKHPLSNPRTAADAITILARKQVPVLCYHQIREWRSTDSKMARDIITSPATFRDQMKMLADSGYSTISPNQLYDYLLYGDNLPDKPVMITFDDNDATQYTQAYPILKEFDFRGVFFIMTVTIGRPKYMSKDQLKTLSEEGNVIASHTWDHHNVQKYQPEDWFTQIEKPAARLEEITGKKVEYFAYPFGLWNAQALPELEKRGMKASFILSTKRDTLLPMQTIRRIIGSGHWNGKTLHGAMVKTFAAGKG